MDQEHTHTSHRHIGVLTFFSYNNFGAALQSYGLYKTLADLGHDVEYIDYRCPYIFHPFSLHSLRKRGPVGYVYQTAGKLFYLPRQKSFSAFHNLMPHTPPLESQDLARYASVYDTVIAGSDQVWNTKLTDFDTSYFLDFVKAPSRKLSYAASFGGATIDVSKRDAYAELLSSFDAISVREDYSKDLVEELGGQKAEVTLDPTLLLNQQEWAQVAAHPQVQDPYILAYQMGFSGALVKAVRALAQRSGLNVQYVPFPLGAPVAGRYRLRLGPKEWLALVRDARYVVTDSYHGVIFSLLFERQFVVVANGQHKNQRVVSLLTRLGLENRVIEGDVSSIDRAIDYQKVKERLEQERRASLSWITSHI